ncbi:unnamed protein product (macronuclear) [Paramecium tetraurelia]|uniref:EF-hand domain-containing protein n=1 Tax=Paramecium tetraurelia TaxID=5888 RepID=A0EHK9_PARTE|nr:uncharacterized protein GSPATT00027124001 [Paramecium tetraurelia]CAK94800.1 unnamed protein product [Paramecium tetraurelia]|eukprot:XP_001462173.1 hypothetical protein (macronuclear) [Paramecium tetraurelia strain d4-2]
MDRNGYLNDKSLFGASSSKSIQRKQTSKVGSQTSRSHYNTSICENERGTQNCKKILTEFLEQTRNRQSTFQFLDQRNKQSQNQLRTTQNSSGFKIKGLGTTYSRKLVSVIPFEKGVTINSDENKRMLIKEAERQFLSQVNGLNKQEVLSKMELFITTQLQEDFKELGLLFQIFMREVQLNHMGIYKLQANNYKQSEIYQNNELEGIIKQQKIEILFLKEQIEELKNECNKIKMEGSKIMAEQRDQLNNERNLIKQMKQKNLEFESKAKKYRLIDLDNQAMQVKLQFYENKIQKLDKRQSKGSESPLGKDKSLTQLNQLIIQQQQQTSKRSLSSNNTLNHDSYSLNQVEINQEKIIEIRSVEIQVQDDLLINFYKDQEVQTDLQLIDYKYEDISQEIMNLALEFNNFNQQNNYQINLDEMIQNQTECTNTPLNYEILSDSSIKSNDFKNIKPQSQQTTRQSIMHRQSIKQSTHRPSEFKQKQIVQFINFQKFRIAQLNNQIEELNQQLQENYQNIDGVTKLNQKLEIDNLQLKLNISEITGKLHQTKSEKNYLDNQNLEQNQIKLVDVKAVGGNKQKETSQTTVGKGPLLGQRITISYDFQKNQSKFLIEKIRQKKIGQIQNTIPIKLVLKYITTLYQEKLQSQKENKLLKDQDMASFIYNYYLKQFGYTKVTEQKFLILLISIQKNIAIVRVNVFAKFLGLLEESSNFSLEEQKKYLEALDLINSMSNYGTTIKNNEANTQQFVPYIRALAYLESLYYFKSQDKYIQLKKELDSIVEKDVTQQNRDGVLDFDQMMLKVLRLFRDNVQNIQTFVINAFNASDLDGNGMCNLEEWLTLNKYIENQKYDEAKLSSKFQENADLVCDGEKYLSFDRFSILCLELDIFSDNSQNNFLNVQNPEEVEQKFGLLRENWAFEYQTQIDKINQSKLDEEFKNKWLEILSVLDDHIVSNPEQKKPILIAWQIYLLETEQYFNNQYEEIQE